MKHVTCRIVNRWNWSFKRSGIWVESAQGGYIWIPRATVDQNAFKPVLIRDLTSEEIAIITKCQNFETGSIELTHAEMLALLVVAKRASGGLWRIGKLSRTAN